MKKLATSAATSQRLSLIASEEALLRGRREKDVADMLLALVGDSAHAGRALREAGIEIAAARAAVSPDQRRSGPEALRDREALDAVLRAGWSERATEVIKASSSAGRAGDSAAVLRALIDEPSGEIAAILARLGTSSAELLTGLASTPDDPPVYAALPPSATGIAGWGEEFVAVGVEQVWSLLASPSRMPEWLEDFTEVHGADGGGGARPGTVWEGTSRAGGRRQQAGLRRQRIELLTADEPGEIAWRFSWPGVPGSNTRCLAIALRAATGGTRLGIGVGWERRAGRAPGAIHRRLLGRVWGLAMHNQVLSTGGGIRRALIPAAAADPGGR